MTVYAVIENVRLNYDSERYVAGVYSSRTLAEVATSRIARPCMVDADDGSDDPAEYVTSCIFDGPVETYDWMEFRHPVRVAENLYAIPGIDASDLSWHVVPFELDAKPVAVPEEHDL